MINIYKNYYIDADMYNFMLKKKTGKTKKKDGTEEDAFRTVAYCKNLDSTYAYFIREMERSAIMDETVNTLKAFIDRMQEVLDCLSIPIKELEALKRGAVAEPEEDGG